MTPFSRVTDWRSPTAAGHLARLAERPPGEAALVAWHGGEPAGVCLLVREELEARHRLAPWLASRHVPEALRLR
jgi:hypothetical protein